MAVYTYPYTILHSKQSTTFFNFSGIPWKKMYGSVSKILFLDMFDINSAILIYSTALFANFEYVVSNLGSVFGRRFMWCLYDARQRQVGGRGGVSNPLSSYLLCKHWGLQGKQANPPPATPQVYKHFSIWGIPPCTLSLILSIFSRKLFITASKKFSFFLNPAVLVHYSYILHKP
jgi:hypothetical protein